MKHRMSRIYVLALLVVFGCRKSNPAPNPIEGVWKAAWIESVWSDGRSINPDPQPGLYIFTSDHYSMTWIPGAQSRKPSVQTWFPTDAEKIADFNTVIVNAGTYELKDSTLTTHPIVAKTPEFMGGWARFVYRVSGDSLWLTGTDIYSFGGVRDLGVDLVRTTVKLVRAE
jgi:hypothetical protein